ncbi:hypothetical protein FPV16_23835 [Methylobacterium sp. W2]|uniref:hypothetical protein n=1 Tax=Methylobacterium sp. W2 TaxID=2598107 RepID=UPI001D0C4856|nr:hypothetical protein [Methylobacterium sp. W2]MCC0809190.1 hypothetical protein [Methylobacterium sp. W2]
MTPSGAIAMLDRQIAAHGQPVTLKRLSPAFSGDLRVFFRGYKPDELAGGIQQGDSTAVLSPTGLSSISFPGLPKVNDKLTVSGRVRNIQAVEPVEIDGVLVRVNLWLRG